MRGPDTAEATELADLRADVRQFIAEHLPPELKQSPPGPFGRDAAAGRYIGLNEEQGTLGPRDVAAPPREAAAQWRTALLQRGWLAPAWPEEYGGASFTREQQDVLYEELERAQAPHLGDHGLSSAGPLIIAVGSEQQKQELLPAILHGDSRWCELFSEPGSGSDLASLQTRAVRDGDEYVVNGHKIWTSGAYEATQALLLARTDPEAPKHRGLSYFMLDMQAPGISVQPLVQMTGTAGSFNQVFLEDVHVPATNLIGEENRGWYYVMGHLDAARGGASRHGLLAQERDLAALLELARAPRPAPLSPAVRRAVTDRAIEVAVLRCLQDRVTELRQQNQLPAYAGSMLKVYWSELDQRLTATAMKVLGLDGLLYRGEERAPLGGMVPFAYLDTMSHTIYMGANEIQRNNIATRGLGLPRS